MSMIGDAITIVDIIRKAPNILKDAELNLRMADLLNKLTEASIENGGLLEKIKLLENELQEVKKRKDYRKNLILKDDAYYFEPGPIDNLPIGPYCTTCFDSNIKLTLRNSHPARRQSGIKYLPCQICKTQ